MFVSFRWVPEVVVSAGSRRIFGRRWRLEVFRVEVGQGPVCVTRQGHVAAVAVLVDELGDELGGEGDDESLKTNF